MIFFRKTSEELDRLAARLMREKISSLLKIKDTVDLGLGIGIAGVLRIISESDLDWQRINFFIVQEVSLDQKDTNLSQIMTSIGSALIDRGMPVQNIIPFVHENGRMDYPKRIAEGIDLVVLNAIYSQELLGDHASGTKERIFCINKSIEGSQSGIVIFNDGRVKDLLDSVLKNDHLIGFREHILTNIKLQSEVI